MRFRNQVPEQLSHGRLFRTFSRFSGVLRERLCQRIGITRFEEDHIFRLALVLHLFDGIIDTVFPGDFLEIPDMRIVAFDGGHALILPDQLFHGLLAVGDDGPFFCLPVFVVGEVFADRRTKDPSGQLCRTYGQRNGSAFDFFLDEASPPVENFMELMPPIRSRK